jgi:hypothetical protein
VSKLNLSWLRNLFVPIIIVSVLFVAFGAFYLYWVPNRQRHLDDRGFRYLNTLSDQIRLTINTYDKMLDNAVDAEISRSMLPQYLNQVAPQLKVPELSEASHAVGSDCDDPPKIAVESDEGTHLLYLAFRRVPKNRRDPTAYVVQTDLDKLINELLGPANLIPFDVVLVARGDGHVIFQKSLSGIDVAQIRDLEDASGQTQGKEQKLFGVSILSPTSRLEEVRIAGARYRLYSQPLPIGFKPANPNRKANGPNAKGKHNNCGAASASTNDSPGEEDTKADSDKGDTEKSNAAAASGDWVLVGLVRADRFRSESQLIPYFYILAMLSVILLAAASYPYVRLYFSLPGERLRARDVAITAVFTCFIAAVVTFILTDIYFWNRVFGPGADGDMARLARAINNNFQIEQNAALKELEDFDERLGTSQALRQIEDELAKRKRDNVTLIYGKSDHEDKCNPGDACKVDILVDPKNPNDKSLVPLLQNYPYPFFAFWSDDEGNQRIKWTTRRRATPFVTLDDSVPFYPDIKRALKRPLKSPAHSDGVPTQGIGSQYSPTTGQNITTFWTVPPDTVAITSEEKIREARYCAALVTQPVSVYNAILPGAFQFAVITPDGTVVFHSDPTRNLRENFLAETDLNPDLRSRVRMRAEGTITTNYLGRPHRMYVLPMNAGNQDGPWTIVIFRDLHMEEVMNLEILGLVSTLFVFYVAAMALVMLSVHWARKHQASRAWFWPDSRKSAIYRRLIIANLVSAAVLLVLSRWLPGLVLLLCVALIAAGVVLFSMLSLRRKYDQEAPLEAPDQPDSDAWCSPYYLAVATLVLAIGVVPCFCFFQVAAVFEHRVLMEHTLLQFATDVENRDLAVRALYQEVQLGSFEGTVLAGPEDWHSLGLDQLKSPVFSYHELLQVFVFHGKENSSSTPSLEDSFLSAISYSYTERSSDDRHLAEGKSDVEQWTFPPTEDDHLIALVEKKDSRIIHASWQPFHLPVLDWVWWLSAAVFLLGVYWLVRLSVTRIFQLNLVAPPPAQEFGSGMKPASLIADLPMDLLLIGHESSRPISALLHRSDVQVHEATELQEAMAPPAKLPAEAGFSKPTANPIEAMIRDGRPLVLRNFERLSDEPDIAARMHAALNRLVSALGNSVVLVSSMDPILIPAIEASDRWRHLLHSFVRIDLNTTPRQRVGEDDAEYQSRISAESYFHWLFAGLPKLDKLVMLQLAQERVVNPNDSELIDGLMEQGMIERKWGLLAVKDHGFAKFLKHALPHHTVRHWEKEIAGRRPFSLQTSLMIVGVGVVAFLVYTQGDVFNTWVTYATGVASAVPKVLQFFDNLRSKTGATS